MVFIAAGAVRATLGAGGGGGAGLSTRTELLRGTAVALIVLAPSLSAFAISWRILDDVILASIVGVVVHIAAMALAVKVARRLFVRPRSR